MPKYIAYSIPKTDETKKRRPRFALIKLSDLCRNFKQDSLIPVEMKFSKSVFLLNGQDVEHIHKEQEEQDKYQDSDTNIKFQLTKFNS